MPLSREFNLPVVWQKQFAGRDYLDDQLVIIRLRIQVEFLASRPLRSTLAGLIKEKLGKRSRKQSSPPGGETRAQKPTATQISTDSATGESRDFSPLKWWTTLHSHLFLTAATILCLIPFSGRAFHVDDTLFIAAARQISQHPFDPYGFQITWDETQARMSEVTQNPPLTSYYIALIARLLGWSERALHVGFLLVTIALVLGTYRLAEKFTRSRLLAALCTLLTPGVLVSASSVMCDTMMLALWVWAAYFWIEGLDSEKTWLLVVSGVLAATSALTKYFGVSLILLLLAYSVVRLRRLGTYLLWLLIPVAILFAYEFWTAELYGHGMMASASQFAQFQHDWANESFAAKAVVGLSFTGGCSLLGLTFAPLVWSRKQIAIVLVVSGIASLTIAAHWISVGRQVGKPGHSLPWFAGFELGLCIAGGIFVLGLVLRDFWEARDADSLFLGLWVSGTFVFAAFVNWTVNARSVLPLIPAVAILLARFLDKSQVVAGRTALIRLAVMLIVSAGFSMWIAAADAELANSARTAATVIYQKTRGQGATLWFQGHWGFQYYMEGMGIALLDPNDPQARAGDFVAVPKNNTHLARISPEFIASQEIIDLPLETRATTISSELGAGFYSSYWGPLPHAIGPVPAERYSIFRLQNVAVRQP